MKSCSVWKCVHTVRLTIIQQRWHFQMHHVDKLCEKRKLILLEPTERSFQYQGKILKTETLNLGFFFSYWMPNLVLFYSVHVTLQFRASGTVTTEDHTDKKKFVCLLVLFLEWKKLSSFEKFCLLKWVSFIEVNDSFQTNKLNYVHYLTLS